MADKSVGELIAAQSVTPTDLFVLEQNGVAKKLTGQVLENWLVSFADGHGGIQSIEKVSTNVLADTYRITLADTTTFDFVVTNGRGVSNIHKKSTSGLVDTYTISYNDGTSGEFTVTNGEKGDKGNNAYIWVKYASQKPTASSNSFGDVPDDWIGVYFGFSSTAPTDWREYNWYKIKGEKGDTGEPATLLSSQITYQVGDSGTIIPSGVWLSSVPVVAQGKYLWTRTTQNFNTGSPVVSYSVSRMGLDGSGSVVSVANISPDENGNVPLTAECVGALPNTGGDLTGELKMNGRPISGLSAPTANDQAANMGFVNQRVKKAAPRNLLDNSDFRNPVMQAGFNGKHGTDTYIIDRWKHLYNLGTATHDLNGITVSGQDFYMHQIIDSAYLIGKTLTMAVHLYDGNTICGSFVLNNLGDTTVIAADVGLYLMITAYGFAIRLDGNWSHTLAWAALYEGEYTIDTLPEYHPKGYGAELAECQRYYQIRSTNNISAVDMRPLMRLENPTISEVSNGYAYSADL